MSEELAYIAGLLDADGCFYANSYLRKGRNCTSLTVRIQVTNTYLPVLEWVREIVGAGHISSYNDNNSSHKVVYAWILNGHSPIEQFLQGVLPYLIIKKEQAELMLAYVQGRIDKGSERRPSIDNEDQELITMIQSLNRRGVVLSAN